MFDETLGGGGDVGPRVLELLEEDARAPRDGEPELVPCCLECRHGLVRELPKSRHSAHGWPVYGHVAGMVQSKRKLVETVARGRKPRCSVRETRHHRIRALACREARVVQLDLEPRVASVVGQQRGRALQKVEHGSKILTEDGGARSLPQPYACSHGEPARVTLPELPPIAICLLEVVADELVELDELGAMLREPVGELLMELRALRLRHALVRRVAHEEMTEAERVLSGEQRSVRTDQLLAHERGQLAREPRLFRRERLDDTLVEHLTFDGAALQHGPLGPLELVEARGDQRLKRRRHLDLAVAGRLHHRHHLLHEERVAARGVEDALAHVTAEHLLPDTRIHQRFCLVRFERLQPQHAPPAAPAVEQLRSGHAQEKDRSARGQERDVLEEIEEDVLSPLDVVEDRDERRLGRHSLEQLAERPRDLVRRSYAGLLEERVERLGRSRIELELRALCLELLHHLDHRPVGDSLAVGEAAATDARRVGIGQELRDETRLAHARRSDDRHELAAGSRLCTFPRFAECSQLSLASDELRVEAPLRRVGGHSEEAKCGHRLALALQLERLDGLDLDRIASQSRAWSRRATSHRVPRPAASAPRR